MQTNVKEKPADTVDKLLSPKEAAALVGITARTMRGWIRCGVIPAYDVSGGTRQARYRVKRSDALARLRRVDGWCPR